jgi:hypothetical protein
MVIGSSPAGLETARAEQSFESPRVLDAARLGVQTAWDFPDQEALQNCQVFAWRGS